MDDTSSTDSFINTINKKMSEKDYEGAIVQCNTALNVYETVIFGIQLYRRALDGVKSNAVSMNSAAETAESSLRDNVGQKIVEAIKSAAQQLIKICSDSDDEMNPQEISLKKKMEWVSLVKEKAIILKMKKEEMDIEMTRLKTETTDIERGLSR